MKGFILGILLFVLCGSGAEAAFDQSSCTRPLGYQQITSLGSAVGVTSVPQGTISMTFTTEVAAIRWRDDGVAPTASVGMPLAVGGFYTYTANFSTIKFIQQAANAVVDVYFCGP